jgi:hypothetical protein
MLSMAFGRRQNSLVEAPSRAAPSVVARPEQWPSAKIELQPLPAGEQPSVEEDLRAWNEERRRRLPSRVPWSSLYLMASLSFGIASFVLPDSVNDAADWLLYILCGASLWAWIAARRKRST